MTIPAEREITSSEVLYSFLRGEARKLGDLVVSKNKVYGNSVFICGDVSIYARMLDKFIRLTNLYKTGAADNGESLIDSVDDLIGYALLFKFVQTHPEIAENLSEDSLKRIFLDK